MSRRRFGTVRKLPSGRYQASYIGPDGARHTADTTFTGKGYADAWLAGQQADIQRGTWGKPAATIELPTFAEHAATALADRLLRPSTAGKYARLLDHHLLPTFGPLRVDQIDRADVSAWWASYGHRTPATRADAYRLLASLMKAAIDMELRGSNPCRIRGGGADPPRAHEIEAATREQVDALAGAMRPPWRMLVQLAAYCQLRFGELAELRRRDVDLAAETVRVRRGMTRVDGVIHRGPPKSAAGVRLLVIPPHLIPELAAHLADHVEPGQDALLFTTPRGAQLYHAVFYREWNEARIAAGLPDFHFHDLRHTGLTWLAQNGASLGERMQRAGHADLRMAIRYEHASAERDRANAARLSRPAGRVVPINRARRGS